ncbi:MAG: hypothetical protein R3332_04420 [Pseudohongiellaceae bacterium]|nr:hypothetical protein [Pseudohongiellaceae bacterium]
MYNLREQAQALIDSTGLDIKMIVCDFEKVRGRLAVLMRRMKSVVQVLLALCLFIVGASEVVAQFDPDTYKSSNDFDAFIEGNERTLNFLLEVSSRHEALATDCSPKSEEKSKLSKRYLDTYGYRLILDESWKVDAIIMLGSSYLSVQLVNREGNNFTVDAFRDDSFERWSDVIRLSAKEIEDSLSTTDLELLARDVGRRTSAFNAVFLGLRRSVDRVYKEGIFDDILYLESLSKNREGAWQKKPDANIDYSAVVIPSHDRRSPVVFTFNKKIGCNNIEIAATDTDILQFEWAFDLNKMLSDYFKTGSIDLQSAEKMVSDLSIIEALKMELRDIENGKVGIGVWVD